ncbi:MAG TPA: molybdate ABC transporter substrate-binding protein [Pyrinomonadaceae bacterium]
MALLLLLLTFCGCQAATPDPATDETRDTGNLTVSAAVSLKDAFSETGNLYKARTGKTVNFNFGASGALQRQIEVGAPVDVFASAGTQQMDALAGRGLLDEASRRDFARNTLVLIVPPDSPLNLTAFADLADARVQKIAVGNPKTVPAGQYTEQVFNHVNLRDKLQAKLILAEDVRQVLDYVVRGEVEAGVVYATDARAAGDRVRVVATAAEDMHAPILYPIAVIKQSTQKLTAQEFVNLVAGAEGQSILRKYGFASAGER